MCVCISIAPKDGNLGKEIMNRDSDKRGGGERGLLSVCKKEGGAAEVFGERRRVSMNWGDVSWIYIQMYMVVEYENHEGLRFEGQNE